jgi:hypothetical protein
MIDYLFYFLQAKYKQWGEADISKVYALVIISLVQFLNLLSVVLCGIILQMLSVDFIKKETTLIAFAVILLANYLYIFRIRGSDVIIAKQAQRKTRNKKLKIFAITYMVASILLIVILMVVHIGS